MVSLSQIESDLIAAIKAKNQLAVETLRGLKTRIQNEKISRMSAMNGSDPGKKDLQEADIFALIRSEVKRRKEAAEAFAGGGRKELAEKELREAEVLSRYLPAQMSEEQLGKLLEEVLAGQNFTAKDFGKAMAVLKAKVGDRAEGAAMARLLKEKLK